MHRQPMDHGDPRLDQIIAACEAGLRRLLRTENADLYMYAANGHGVWEATTSNLLAPGEAMLIPGTGHFSEQWALQAEAIGRRAIRTPYREGYPIDPNEVEQTLRADRKREIAAVFVVHTDTASGISNDLQAIRAAIDAAGHPALFVVDVVASLAAAPFAMDALGVNVAVGASQKGLMSPPGLGLRRRGPARRRGRGEESGAAPLLGLGAAQGDLQLPEVRRHPAAEPAVRDRGRAGAARSRRTRRGVRPPRPAWRARCRRRSSAGRARARCSCIAGSRRRARYPSLPSRCATASTSRPCARSRANASRWRSRAPSVRCRGALSHRASGRLECGDDSRLPRRRGGRDARAGIPFGRDGVARAVECLGSRLTRA